MITEDTKKKLAEFGFTRFHTKDGQTVNIDRTVVLSNKCRVEANNCIIIGNSNFIHGIASYYAGEFTSVKKGNRYYSSDEAEPKIHSKNQLAFLFAKILKDLSTNPLEFTPAPASKKEQRIPDRGLELLERDDDSKDPSQCVICLVNNRCVVLQPCGHLTVCNSCALDMGSKVIETEDGDKKLTDCPICRKKITSFQRTFRS